MEISILKIAPTRQVLEAFLVAGLGGCPVLGPTVRHLKRPWTRPKAGLRVVLGLGPDQILVKI